MMEKKAMSLESFERLTQAYGAALDRWPEDERVAAEELLAASAEARAMRDRAAGLDRLLDRLPEHRPSPALRGMILAQTAGAPRRGLAARFAAGWRGFWAELGHPVPVGLVLAASLTLGLVLGAGTFTRAPQPGVDLVQFALLSDLYAQE